MGVAIVLEDQHEQGSGTGLDGDSPTDRIWEGVTGVALDHDRSRCLHHVLEESARLRPDRVAVWVDGATRTFAEVDAFGNRLARVLREIGVATGDIVAFCLDRVVDLPGSMAGILKAGAAYLPLDPAHPVQRLRNTLAEAGPACIVTTQDHAAIFDGLGIPVLMLDRDAARLAAQPDGAPGSDVGPRDLAYVIYTSGSTGRPKGVEVEHRNVVAFLESMRREPGLRPDDTLLSLTTLSFDMAVPEVWLPLMVGARLVLASRAQIMRATELLVLMNKVDATFMQGTPVLWRSLVESGWAGKPNLRAVCGGEALPRNLAASLVPRVSELWNLYGPTETTVWSTMEHVTDPEKPISVGRPIANTTVFILDESGHNVGPDAIGELCIGGEGVARGYRGRADLTAESFQDIETAQGPARIYRTGDLARFDPEGRLMYLGRRDQQVKIRGHRIELGEIEEALNAHPLVRHAVVTACKIGPDLRLAAFMVVEPAGDVTGSELRQHLRDLLPDVMIPSHYVPLDALPQTTSGKVDRAALPNPFVNARRPQAAHELPATELERTIARVWRDLLGVETVGANDNFFEIGGHSLLSVRAASAIASETGIELNPRSFFYNTLRQLAASMSDLDRAV